MNSRRRNNRGSILIIVLWTLFLLTTFAVELGVIVRQKMTLMNRLDTQDKLLFIAEAGVKKAIAELRKDDSMPEADALSEPWGNNDVNFRDIQVDGGAFNVYYEEKTWRAVQRRFGVADEESKVNVNTADVETLTRLLQKASGLSEDEALPLAYALIDWRDADSYYQHPQYGAEDEDYKDLESPYEAKDENFELLDELLLVKGMTPEIYEELRRWITVHGGGKININTVPVVVLESLGLGAELAEQVAVFRAGTDGVEGTADDNIFMDPGEVVSKLTQAAQLPAQDAQALAGLIDRGFFIVKSEYFRIQSSAVFNGRGGTFEIVAVVDRRGHIRYWREYF